MSFKAFSDYDFIKESNRIEGITRPPTKAEKDEFNRFVKLPIIRIGDLIQFVSVYQPGAVLRDKANYNVRVGNHVAPPGGMAIVYSLDDIVADATLYCRNTEQAFHIHNRYETLHPFTDGNGRSGRILWRWMMGNAPLGFLHHWYYQSLEYGRK